MSEPVPDDAPRGAVRFGRFELDLESSDLLADSHPVQLAPRPLAVLEVLVSNAGRTVSREALREAVWGQETHLQFEQSLNSCIRRLRAALGDDSQSPRWIETVPRRGYRFIGRLDSGPGTPDVLRAHEKSPDSKPPASRPAGTPRWMLGWIVASLIALGLGAWIWRTAFAPSKRPVEGSVPPPAAITLAVAPFPAAESTPVAESTPAAESTSDASVGGLGYELHRRLARIAPRRIHVLGIETAARLEAESPESALASVSVDAWLRGRLLGEADRRRLEVALTDADSRILWRRTVVLDEADDQGSMAPRVMATEIARTLIESHALDVRLGAIEPETGPGEAISRPALDAYLRGLYLRRQQTSDALEGAIASFEESVALAPGLASAWGELAQALAQSAWPVGRPDSERLARTVSAAERALALDPEQADAHLALGYVALYSDRDIPGAHAHFRSAVDAAAGEAEPHSASAAVLAARGEVRTAVAEARLAEALDPLNMVVQSDLCWYLVFAERFEDADRACGRALDFAPGNRYLRLGWTVALEQVSPARAVAQWLLLLAGGDAPLDAWGRPDADPTATLEAIRAWFAERQHALLTSGRGQPLMAAAAFAAAGRHDDALAALERALEQSSAFLVFVSVDPRYRALRSDPRFIDLVHRIV